MSWNTTALFIVLVLNLIFCLGIVSTDHAGAYSSPQYAKKLYPMKPIYDTNDLLPKKSPAVFKRYNSYEVIDRSDNDTVDYGRSSILSSASNFLSSSSGQMVTNLAKDFIARSTGSSQVGFECITQVLSLNLTNLVILVVLKALVLAAGFFGAGAWKGGHGYGRSIDDNKNADYISEDEILLYLSYLAGQQSQDFGCLYRLSCKRPEQASLYYSGADLLLQGAKLFQGNSTDLISYEEITEGLRDAAAWGMEGMPCASRYKCGE